MKYVAMFRTKSIYFLNHEEKIQMCSNYSIVTVDKAELSNWKTASEKIHPLHGQSLRNI